MNKYIVDAWVWIDYFDGVNKKIKNIIEEENNELYTTLITVSEVISVSKRKNKDVDEIFKALTSLSQIFESNLLFHKEVGILHAEIRKTLKDFGIADTFVLLAARKLKAKILTCDDHFRSFKEAIFVK